MVCVDTTFLIDLIHKDRQAEKKLISLRKSNDEPSTTVMSVAELFYGAYKSNNVAAEKKSVIQALSGFAILEMTELGAEKFGQILSTLDKQGQKVSDRDVLIAAIALSMGENVIITRNGKDFLRIPELTVVTY
jgi:tRNA(fMet)-specific endonuclease VapC